MTNETGMTVDEAQAYNRRLIDSGQYDLGQPDAEQQNGSGDSGTVIGRILIPTISTDLPIRQSSDAETLRRGAGLLHDTSLPVGGPGTAGCTARRSIPIYGFMPTIPATTIPLVTFTHAIGTELQRLLRNRTNSLISRHATRTTASASSRQSPIPTPSNGTLVG